MNRNAAGHIRPNPTLSQRQREVLALYAASPAGERLLQFCERAGIHRDTWHEWRTRNPEFAAQLEHIRQERVQVALEPLQEAVPLLVDSLVKLAKDGSIAALRTAGDWLGLTRRATHNVQVAVDARGLAAEPAVEYDLDALLQEHAELSEHMNRRMPLDYLKQRRDRLIAAIASREGVGAEPLGRQKRQRLGKRRSRTWACVSIGGVAYG